MSVTLHSTDPSMLDPCITGINNERSKRCALEEAIIEKDLRFQSPLHFVDQPELYYSCLQIALVQLRLVEKVLRCDYEAARKDFAASRISVRPDVTDLVTVTDEIQNTRTLLAEVRQFHICFRLDLGSLMPTTFWYKCALTSYLLHVTSWLFFSSMLTLETSFPASSGFRWKL